MRPPCFVQGACLGHRMSHLPFSTGKLNPIRQSELRVSTFVNPLDRLRARIAWRVLQNEAHSPERVPLVHMNADDSSTSSAMRIGSLVVVAGLVLSSFLPAIGVFRNMGNDAAEAVLNGQLGRVPVFTVTDETGHPLLSETDDHLLRRGYFFIHPADAEKYLERVKETSSDAKVLTIGLNEAIKYLDAKSTPSKSVPERFELFPDDHEVELASQVTNGEFQRVFGSSAVPIFYVDGLGVKSDDQEGVVYPLFFEKEKLDEMVDGVKSRDPKASTSLKDLQVVDLRQTIKEIRAGSNPRLNRVIFVPLSEALKTMNARSAQ